MAISFPEVEVTFKTSTGGTISPTGSKTMSNGDRQTITATPYSAYVFDKWTTDGNGGISLASSATTNPNSVIATGLEPDGWVQANFKLKPAQYTVSYSTTKPTGVSGDIKINNSIQGTPYSATYTAGTQLTIEAVPAGSNSVFSHWEISSNINATGTNTTLKRTITINGNGTVHAVFSKSSTTTITVNRNNTSYGKVSWSSATLTVGDTKSITASPTSSSYKFSKWENSDGKISLSDWYSSTATVTAVQAGNATLTAVFVSNTLPTLNTPTVSHSSTDGASGTNYRFAIKSSSGNYTPNITYSWTRPSNAPSGTTVTYTIYVVDTADSSINWTYTRTTTSMTDYFYYGRIGHSFKFRVTASASGYNSSTSAWSSAFTIRGWYQTYDADNKLYYTSSATASFPNNNNSSLYPAVSGKALSGWKNASGTVYSNFGTAINLTKDNCNNAPFKAYAVYKNNSATQYTISYNANGGTIEPASQKTSSSTAGQLTISLTKSTRSGYTFLGFVDSASATSAAYLNGKTYTFTANKVLFAVWKADKTVSYNNGGGTGSIASTTAAYNATITLSDGSAFTKSGSSRKYWQAANGTTYSLGGKYTAQDSTTMTMVWGANNYTLSYTAPTYGPTTYVPSSQAVSYGSVVTLPSPTAGTNYDATVWAPKNPFWKLSNNDTVAAGGTYTYNYTGNLTATPQWSKITGWKRATIWVYVPQEEG